MTSIHWSSRVTRSGYQNVGNIFSGQTFKYRIKLLKPNPNKQEDGKYGGWLSDELVYNLNVSLALVQLLVEFSCTVHQLSGPVWEAMDTTRPQLWIHLG